MHHMTKRVIVFESLHFQSPKISNVSTCDSLGQKHSVDRRREKDVFSNVSRLIKCFSFIHVHKGQFSPKQTAWPSHWPQSFDWEPDDWRGWLRVLWSVKHDCANAFKCAWSEITHSVKSWDSALSPPHL